MKLSLKKHSIFFYAVAIFSTCLGSLNKPKVLHIGFHLGCIKDFEDVAKELSINLTSWFIFSKPLEYLDGTSKDFKVYNITHDKAQRIWDRHHSYFEQFDIILISDTAPLARAFLQNNFAKPLIIWICNRFDYDHGGFEEGFPDTQYYDLFRKACTQKNVKIVGYTAYEHTYAHLKGVPTSGMIIKPFGSPQEAALRYDAQSNIPAHVQKNQTLFLYPQLRDEQFLFIKNECNKIGMPTYSGKFNGPNDLINFKGVVYFPYQVSNLVFFEGINRGIIFFVPSKRFFKSLVAEEKVKVCNYSFAQRMDEFIDQMEWYLDWHQDILVYFDSWADLKQKVATLDYDAMRTKVKSFGAFHRLSTISRWKKIFSELENNL